MDAKNNVKHSLCWDCAKSTNNGCSWSADFVPVEGWTAVPMQKKTFDSFRVDACPEFERDEKNFGLKRLDEEDRKNVRGSEAGGE